MIYTLIIAAIFRAAINRNNIYTISGRIIGYNQKYILKRLIIRFSYSNKVDRVFFFSSSLKYGKYIYSILYGSTRFVCLTFLNSLRWRWITREQYCSA